MGDNPGPDYQFGWGLMDLSESLRIISAGAYLEDSLSVTGDFEDYSFYHSGGDLSFSLVWTDPPPDLMMQQDALVNDLDLMLISPQGTPFLPWVLDPDNPEVNATQGVNSVDNVEQVVVSNAASGNWTIRVTAASVSTGPQNFALVLKVPSNIEANYFTVFNDGNALLDVTSIAPQTLTQWLFTSEGDVQVAAGESAPVSVSVDYALAPVGTSVTLLDLVSNDPDENPYPGGVEVTVTTADSDQDGLNDSLEGILGTNTDLADSDGDGISDFDEVNQDGDPTSYAAGVDYDPVDDDTDSDGLFDGFEVQYGFNPNVAGEQDQDGDNDGLINLEEQALGTDPTDADSDNDGVSDGQEVEQGTDPLSAEHEITILNDPASSVNPLTSGGSADLSVTAIDSQGHSLTYTWSASCLGLSGNGSFDDTSQQYPEWTAPINVTGSDEVCSLEVSIDDGNGLSVSDTIDLTVNSEVLPPSNHNVPMLPLAWLLGLLGAITVIARNRSA